jgi:hypothetical protein
MQKLIQKKQIEGLVSDLSTLFGNVAAISVGTPTLEGTTLKIPFTDKDGNTTQKQVDLASLAVDVNVASATIDANTYVITVTETDGSTHNISLATVLANYITANVTPAIQAAQADATQALANAATADSKATAAQTAANNAQSTANDALSTANAAQTTANSALTAAQAADAKAVVADGKAVAAQTTADSALALGNTLKDKKMDGMGFWSKKTISATVSSGLVEVSSSSAPLSEVLCASFVTVNGVTHPVTNSTSGQFFLSKDNGATAVAGYDTNGAKLYCNVSQMGYSLEAGDELAIYVGYSLPRLGVAY